MMLVERFWPMSGPRVSGIESPTARMATHARAPRDGGTAPGGPGLVPGAYRPSKRLTVAVISIPQFFTVDVGAPTRLLARAIAERRRRFHSSQVNAGQVFAR